jgi:site-specific recombinase XerD
MRCHYKELLAIVDDKSMREAIQHFEFNIRAKNLSPKTISVYGERLGYFARYLREQGLAFCEVTRLTVQQYILHLKDRGLADISINGQLKVLRIFYKFLLSEELAETDPTSRIQLLKTERRLKPILSESQIEQLLSVPNRKIYTGMRNFCIILVFYDTLIRLQELINIKIQDVDLESGIIKIMGKGRKERVVPFGATTAKHLHRFLRGHRRTIPGDILFCNAKGHALDQRNVQRILERIGDRVGVHVSPHLIRHTAASDRALSGMPAFLLQRLLGHTTIQMTEKYVHLVDSERLRLVSRQHSPLDSMRV